MDEQRVPDETEAPAKVPLDVAAVGAVFVLVGALAAMGVVTGLLRARLRLDLTILALFIGVGLLRLRPSSREWALLFIWIAVIGSLACLLLLPLTSVTTTTVRLDGHYLFDAPRWAGMTMVATTLVVSAAMLYVLRREAVRELFRPRSVHRPWAFSQALHERGAHERALGPGGRTLVGCMVALAVVTHLAGGYVYERLKPVDEGWISFVGERGHSVNYGYRLGKLTYVVFTTKPAGPIGPPVRTFQGPPDLDLPDGSTRRLAGRPQLYQITDGELTVSDERVTGEQLEAYLDSRGPGHSLDGLLAFVRGG